MSIGRPEPAKDPLRRALKLRVRLQKSLVTSCLTTPLKVIEFLRNNKDSPATCNYPKTEGGMRDGEGGREGL